MVWWKKQRSDPAYIQKRENAERKRKEAEYDSDRQKIVVALQRINEQNDTANNREQSHEREVDRLEGKRFWLSVGTVVGVWVAAILTAVQAGIFYRTMHEAKDAASIAHADNIGSLSRADAALKQAQNNFIADQRPIIWYEDNPVTPGDPAPVPPGPIFNSPRLQIAWNIFLKNYGRSTAIDVSYALLMKIGNGDFHGSYTTDNTRDYMMFGFGKPAPMPPSTDNRVTILSRPGSTTKSDFDALVAKSGAISVKVIVRYKDTANTSYETAVCMTKLSNLSLGYCESYVK